MKYVQFNIFSNYRQPLFCSPSVHFLFWLCTTHGTVGSIGCKPYHKHLLHCTPKLHPAQLFISAVNIYISLVWNPEFQYHMARCPFWLQQWYVLPLSHMVTHGPLLLYLWVRVNNRMSEGARVLKRTTEQKKKKKKKKKKQRKGAASAKALSTQQSLDRC